MVVTGFSTFGGSSATLLNVSGFSTLGATSTTLLNVSGIATFTDNVILNSTNAVQIPVGTIEERGFRLLETKTGDISGVGTNRITGINTVGIETGQYILGPSGVLRENTQVESIGIGSIGIGLTALLASSSGTFRFGTIDFVAGQIRYNSESSSFEGYGPNNSWGPLSLYFSDGSGGGSNQSSGTLTIEGTSNEVDVSLTDSTYTISLPDQVSITTLNVSGIATFTDNVILNSTNAVQIPVGTIEERGFRLLETKTGDISGVGTNRITGINTVGIETGQYILGPSGVLRENTQVESIGIGSIGIGLTALLASSSGTFRFGTIDFVAGQIRYNSESSSFEGYGPNNSWGPLSLYFSDGSGGGSNQSSGTLTIEGTSNEVDVSLTDSTYTISLPDQVSITTLSVSGVSTLTGGVNADAGIKAARLNVTGISTLGQTTTTGLKNTGISSLGLATADTLVVTGFSTFGSISATNANFTGVTSITSLSLGEQLALSSFTVSTEFVSTAGVNTLSATQISTLEVTGISTLGQTTTAGLKNTGISSLGNATADTLNVTGVATASSFSGSGSGLSDVPITSLDIDGGTELSSLANEDLFIVDDGAGGTNRKITASNVSAYVLGGASGSVNFQNLNVTGIGTVGLLSATNANIGVLTATDIVGNGDGITSVRAGILTGSLPPIDGSQLTGIVATGTGVQIFDGYGGSYGDGAVYTGIGITFVYNTDNVTVDFNAGITTIGLSTFVSIGGSMTATSFHGDGSGLTNAGAFNYDNTTNVFTQNITSLPSRTDGANNFFAGRSAGHNITSADSNIAIGSSSGLSLTSGHNNIFLGACAGCNSNTAYHNVFLGNRAGCNNSGGDYNTFIGYLAGRDNTTGSYNFFLGGYAGYNNNTGCFNTFIGQCAGYDNCNASNNTFIGYQAGKCNSTGAGNFFVGQCAGYFSCTGFYNNFLGDSAGYCNTEGCDNNFLGRCAGCSNTSGSYNNFFGHDAGCNNTTGSFNNFIGECAGFCNTDTNGSVAIGQSAGYHNDASDNIFLGRNTGFTTVTRSSSDLITGSDNFISGVGAGSSLTTGCNNTFIGNSVGTGNTSGSYNNFLGNSAGRCNTTGCNNNFFGNQAGFCNTSGIYNNFFGSSAGYKNTTGCHNNFLGNQAGYCNTSGSWNVFIGERAGYCSTTGCHNNFFGCRAGCRTTGVCNNFFGAAAGVSNTSGSNNNFFGSAGGNNTTGSHNNFFGRSAGWGNGTGENNNFIGNCAGYGNSSGCYNNFFGPFAGFNNTTGCYNNFFGRSAGRCNLNGYDNVAIGRYAAHCRTTGHSNVSIGNSAGYFNTGSNNTFIGVLAGSGFASASGSYNIFFGHCSGRSNTSGACNLFAGVRSGACNTTGEFNIFFGHCAGHCNTDGDCNIVAGYKAGFSNETGCHNVFLGWCAGATSTKGEQIAIGYNARVAAPTESTQLAIGIGNTNWIDGNESYFVGFGITNPTQRVDVGGNIKVSGELHGPTNFVIDPAAVGDNTGSVRIKGDLYVDGDNFVVNSETITLGDFVVGIASTVPNRTELDGAGIGIGSDVTFLYDDTNTALKSNVNLNLSAADKTYKINGTDVLSATTLGSGVVNSSLTSVGNLTSLTVSGGVSVSGSGGISVVGVVTASDFNSTSDQKLKTNIQRVENAVDKVQQIDGVSFNWIENDKPSMGVIADQVEKVLPELVSNTDPKTVNYNGLIGLLIEVVKEQQTQINDLNERLSRLE